MRDIKIKNLRVRGGIIITTHPNTRPATQGRRPNESYKSKRRPEQKSSTEIKETINDAGTQHQQPSCDQLSDLPQVIPLTPDIIEYVPLRQPRAAVTGVQHNPSKSMTQCTVPPAPTSTPPTLASTIMTPEEQWESAIKKLREYTRKEIILDRHWDLRTQEISQQQEATSGRDEETVQQLVAVGEPLPIQVAPAAAPPAAPEAALPIVVPMAVPPVAPAEELIAERPPEPAEPARRFDLERALARQQEIVRREHQDLVCFRCQERGHVQRYCMSDNPGRYCYKCSAPGYDTMSCPYCAKYQKRAVENVPEGTLPSLLDLDFSHLTLVEDEEGRKKLVAKQ
ncbi:hypothetical protein TKK_0010011 [Trichogramma kaykai]|uniref:CCHC-type domain-containing protein n=1 Tax=Trichogramma kaykai TaxID=54128 RepID=A0ABD2WYR6_9HYME